jgi:hypothetical protein
VDLSKLIQKYCQKIIHIEKQKLTREMVFYKGEENDRKYEQTRALLETVDTDVVDNLKRMAFHVVTPDFN